MRVSTLYVVSIKSAEYQHEERVAFTSMYEADCFIQACRRCAWGEKAEATIETIKF